MKPLVECCSLTKKFGEFYALTISLFLSDEVKSSDYSARTEAEKPL